MIMPTDTTAPDAESIAANLEAVRQTIAAASTAADRDAETVRLVAISKTNPASAVEAALAAGQTLFGENRVQEAKGKFPALKERHPELELHLVGALQSNKAREAVELFDLIQSLDRPKLAKALAQEMDRLDRRPACLVQINTGEEPQKAGVLPRDADAFIAECRDVMSLPLAGLMCIPPFDEEPAPHFAFLREIAKRNGLDELSMGMSADYETAIQFGATYVRVGTAIFGARPKPT